MFVIEKNKKIILTKGDTASIYIEVQDLEGKPFDIGDSTVTLTVRKTPKSEVSIQKEATPDHYIIFDPEDTSDLKVGLYVYDVQLETDDNIYTIVPMSYFELRNEVTR